MDFSQLNAMIEKLIASGIDFGKSLLAALVIYIVGRWLIKIINRFVKKWFDRRDNLAPEVESFIASMINITLMILLLLSVISALGIETTSFAALLASAGVAIGMALSGNLQNFAAGLIILMFRPYKIGDYIEIGGVAGTVKAIQIFQTVLVTPDNKVIMVPNNQMTSNVLTNYNGEETRRVDMVFGVEYGSDYEKVKASLEQMIAADERILKEPAMFIGLDKLADSSVNVVIKVWVKSCDYWGVYYDFNRLVYDKFPKEGIEFPFTSITVYKGEATK